MPHAAHTLITENGGSLYYQSWRPDGEVRGVVLVVHGAAEHGGRYAGFARQLTRRGFAVVTIDLPGHGKSSGPRCSVADFDVYLDAVEQAHRRAEQEFTADYRNTAGAAAGATAAPFYLVGHSMGGLVAVLYLMRHQAQFVGAVFSGAALTVDPQPGALQVLLVRGLARLAPGLGILKLDAAAVSRDPDVVSRYIGDPLVYGGKLPARFLVALFGAMARARDGMPELTLPLLALHGEADRLVPPAASRLLIERCESQDKTLRMYPGLYHEIFNEPEHETIVDELVDWVEARLPAGDGG